MKKVVRGITYRTTIKLIKEWRESAEHYERLKIRNHYDSIYRDALRKTYLACASELEKLLEVKEG